MTESKIITKNDQEQEHLHPLVAALTRGDLDTETMHRVLELQERWEDRRAAQAFTAALVELKRHMPAVISHDKRVRYAGKGGRVAYSHLSLAGLLEAVEPHLTEHGFALTFEAGNPNRNEVSVTATLSHRAGHSKSIELAAPPDSGSGRNAIQAIASTTTYLRRYTAAMLLGVATSDMPDPDAPPPLEVSPGLVDIAQNHVAASWIEEQGLALSDAEKHVGRQVDEWSMADLGKLKTWAKEKLQSVEVDE